MRPDRSYTPAYNESANPEPGPDSVPRPQAHAPFAHKVLESGGMFLLH